MTKAEARQMQRLQNEVSVLREQNAKHIRLYGDHLSEIAEMKIKLKTMAELIGELAAEVVK